MLVLVLILVVIALVLLLAGWFLHLVVLAWTSVGISVLAGLVLLYDWWQTRSAVRAGRQGSGPRDGDGDRPVPPGAGQQTSVVGAGAGPDGFGGADMEPATQVLPIVPPPSNAAEETVVMPVVAPSGSADAPSGASRSGGVSSQSVTGDTVDEPVAARPADGATTAVDPSAGREPGGGGDPATGTAAPGESGPDRAREAGSVGAGAARTPDAEQVTTAATAGGEPPAGATRAVPATDGAAGASGAGGASGAAGAAAVGGAVAAGGAVAGGAALAGGADATGGSAPGQPDARPVDPPTRAEQAPAGGAGPDDPTSVAAASGGAPGGPGAPPADDRTRAAAIDTSGEAPEEPRDPAHASVVARLPDEVVVIDEHPRYHVQGCPSLPGQAVIPLPVSEAVELGFTPCGWCSPNRVLSERHPAEAR